ncbi:MAG: hypothetical protein JKY95_12110 [Planctomycetaceae bacterium]|nr:hypothetical protein [Planctomycetaceae bacterium]
MNRTPLKTTAVVIDYRMISSGKYLLFVMVVLFVITSTSALLFSQDAPADKQNKTEEADASQDEAANTKLPMLEDLPLPEFEELLNGEKQDWIVLISGRVLKVPTVQPRPDHLERLLDKQKMMSVNRPRDPGLLEKWLEEYRSYNFISIEYTDQGDEKDYSLAVRYIDYILYHEDLVLQKAAQLIKAGNAVDAQRLISVVARWNYNNNIRRKQEKNPEVAWPKLLDRQRDLLLLNVRQAQSAKLWERSFSLSKNHRGFDPQFKQLPRLLGQATADIAQQALQNKDYRKVRFFIRQLQAMYPAHEQVNILQNQLTRLSKQEMQQATQAHQKKNYREASEKAQLAIRIWPHDSQHRRQVQIFQERYQILRTGQIATDDQITLHRQSLLNHHWFHIEKISEGYPRYRSRFIESWTPGDLGLSIQLKIKLSHGTHESQPELESYQLAEQLAAASLKSSPENRRLFANSIQSIHVISPDQLDIHIATQTAHPLGLFAGLLDTNFAPEQYSLENSFYRPEEKKELTQDGEPIEVFVRASPEPDNAKSFGIAEVLPRLFANRQELLRSLLRDELDYVPNLPLEYVKQLKQDQRFFVLKYRTPKVNLIHFHFHGAFSQDPALRLALFSALNREKMMAQTIEHQQADQEYYRITNSIAPSNSHANNQSEHVVKYDRTSARALYTILSGTRKISPELRLLVSEDAESIQLAEFIKVQWESLGLKVKLVSANSIKDQAASPPRQALWDARIVSHRMLAPQHDLPRLLANNKLLTETDLQTLPLPIQRSLLKLEQAHNWDEVDFSLRELQDHLAIDAWMLPLWEQHCYQAARREIRHIPATPLRPYQNLDHWVIAPIIPAY